MPLRFTRSLVVLALIVAACSGDAVTDTTTTTTQPPDGSSTTTSQASTTTGPATSEQVLEWQRFDDPAFDGGFLNGIVAAGPGLVAVGTDEVPEDAAVWVSVDGTEWERIRSESFRGIEDASGLEGRQFMIDVAVGPAGIVAVGGYERREARDLDPGVWISQDGSSWERITDPDFEATGAGHLNAITVWNGTYVAVGESPAPVGSEEHRPAIWTSSDGRDWVEATGLALRTDGVVIDITSRGSRLVAVGASGHVGRPTVWFSDDGTTWDVIASEDSGDSVVGSIEIGDTGELQDMFMTSVAITRDGFVAVGGVGEPARTAFWESDDGLFWTLVGTAPDVERSNMPVFAESLVTTSTGLVAVGTGRLDTTRFPPLSFAEVWVSFDDGSSWAQQPRTSTSMAVEGPTSPWHIGAMHDIISFDGALVAVGYVPYQDVTLPGPFYHQAVWIGTWQ